MVVVVVIVIVVVVVVLRKSSDQAACDPGSETVSHKRQFSSLASSGRVPAFITGATRCATHHQSSYDGDKLPGPPLRRPMYHADNRSGATY